MEGDRRDRPVGCSFWRHALGLGAAAAIDDAALAGVARQQIEQLRGLADLRLRRRDAGWADGSWRRTPRPQSMRSACRMSARVRGSAVAVSATRGTPGKRSRQAGQLAVFRAELVAPLRDAMRLVDREQRELQARQPLHRAVAQQPFGRDVEQVELLLDQVARDAARFGGIELGMQRAGRHAELAQRRDLVVHQRDQRRDDHRGAGPAQRGHLVADALAAAGRHQHQRVAAGDDVVAPPVPAGRGNRGSRTPGAAPSRDSLGVSSDCSTGSAAG